MSSKFSTPFQIWVLVRILWNTTAGFSVLLSQRKLYWHIIIQELADYLKNQLIRTGRQTTHTHVKTYAAVVPLPAPVPGFHNQSPKLTDIVDVFRFINQGKDMVAMINEANFDVKSYHSIDVQAPYTSCNHINFKTSFNSLSTQNKVNGVQEQLNPANGSMTKQGLATNCASPIVSIPLLKL